MTNEPLISVIIPVYSGSHLLHRAVESALAQTVSLEIIVINDCSPEEVDCVMAAYADNPAIIYLKNPQNMGAAETRNRGVSMQKASMLHFWMPMTIGPRTSWNSSLPYWNRPAVCYALPPGN